MSLVEISNNENIAVIRLNRGKVNAINREMIDVIGSAFRQVEADPNINGVVFTGSGKFFSFGFDIPELFPLSPEEFSEFLIAFSDLYKYLYLYQKPVVAALNGHTVAGGCMLATTCDYRIVSGGKAKLSLNEIALGVSVFAGSVEMLKAVVGHRNAEIIMLGGKMYSVGEAKKLGLVDEIVEEAELIDSALAKAKELGANRNEAYGTIKRLFRQQIADDFSKRERAGINRFVELWHSPETRDIIGKVQIRS